MKIEKQREVVIEFEHVRLIRKKARTKLDYCPGCDGETDFVTLCQAAALFDIDAAQLLEFVRAHGGYCEPDAAGMLTICLACLLDRLKRKTDFSRLKLLGG